MPNMSNSEESLKPTTRAFAPLEREVELTRELVANLREITILKSGYHDKQIEQYKQSPQGQTETKRRERTLRTIESFAEEQVKRFDEAMAGNGSVLIYDELKAYGRQLQSYAGTILSMGIKAEKHFNTKQAETTAAVELEVPVSTVKTATPVEVKEVKATPALAGTVKSKSWGRPAGSKVIDGKVVLAEDIHKYTKKKGGK